MINEVRRTQAGLWGGCAGMTAKKQWGISIGWVLGMESVGLRGGSVGTGQG